MKTSSNAYTTDADFDPEGEFQPVEDKASKAKRFAADLERQFAALPMAIFADVRSKKLKHRDVCLYAHLLVKQGDNRSTFWGIDRLAILTGTNATSVKDSLRRLVKCGHIKRERSKLTTHTICLTRLPRGKGAAGILVKGRRVGEAPLEKPESEPAVTPVRQTPHPVSHNASVRSSCNVSNNPRNAHRGSEEPCDFIRDTDEFLASIEAGNPA